MSATAQIVYYCASVDPTGSTCTQWVQAQLAMIPGSDVPTINQFLSVLGDALYNPTPADIAYVFSWGFGAVIFMWSFGFAVGVVTRLLRSL